MSRQYFADLMCEPLVVTPSAIVATTETVLVATQYTPIPANDPRPGKVYQLLAGGIMSTSTSGTLIINPRYGLVVGAVSMGVSITQTVPFSMTAIAWHLVCEVVIRTVGLPGTNSTVMCNGFFNSGGLAATSSSGIQLAFGGTSATVDVSVAAGLWLGWTLSVAGSVTVTNAIWRSLN